MNKWFGENWGAPCCTPGDHVPTPIGIPCAHCDEPIEIKDQGMMIDNFGEPSVLPWHLDCFLRSVVGSVGHLNKKCHCFGGTEEDPPNMSKREAASAAVRLFNLHK